MTRIGPTVAALFLMTGVLVPAQDIQIVTTTGGESIQLPMGQRQFKTGTGRIHGRILAADTGSPVRRAQVRIGGGDAAPRAALTDADGQFEFRDLPAGRFTLTASKSGYVSVQYGQTRPHQAGRPIELAEGQRLDGADIHLPRGSVISGRVVDEYGEPVADAMVASMRLAWQNGRRRLLPTGRMGQTNDLGQFRIYGLPPGDYFVSASLRAGGEMMMFDMLGGGAAGSAPSSGYAPTYYPGSPSPTEAQRISLGFGHELGGIDFSLTPVPLARISGVVIGSDGRPLEGAAVNVVPRGGDVGVRFMMFGPGGRTTKEGAFTLNGVAPGEYNLQVRTVRRAMQTVAQGGTFVSRIDEGGPATGDEFATLQLTVTGEDIPNVVVSTSRGSSMTGRVRFEGGAPPAEAARIRVIATPADTDGGPVMMMGGGSADGVVGRDGTFTLRGLAGPRVIRVAGLPAGWMLQSVRMHGTDVTDTGIDVRPGSEYSGLEVVVTSRTTEVAGSVTDGRGRPIDDYTVIVFGEDPDLWTVPMTRHVTGVRPDQEGRFRIRHMPPGSYYAVAVDYVAQGEWGDPDLLERIRSSAERFTLSPGGTATLALRLVPLGG